MKKIIFFLLLSLGLNAQFNYQAIVKDNNGVILTNNQVKIKFSASYESSSVSPVFIEEHTLTTPADGVINISIGEGTTIDGSFSNIDWSQGVYIKEELDSGNGYQDMGTSRILSVPIAEYAKKTSLTSSTFLDEKLNLSLGTKVPMSESNASTGKNTGIGPNTLVNIETGSENTAIGYNSLNATTIGSANVGIGNNTLESLENGYYNVAVGSLSLSANVSGVSNVGIGLGALAYGDEGNNNIAIGRWVLAGNKADLNIGLGAYALTNNVTGTNNIGIGPSSLRFNEDGSNNVAIGPNAGQYLNSEANVFIGNHAGNLTTTGRENIAIGANAFQNNTEGRNNTLVGGGVGSNIDGGSYNAIYGDQSGLNVTTSSNLTLIGRGADIASAEQLQSPTQIQNSTAIGANAIVTTSNTIQLGNQGVTLVNTSGTISATAFIGDGSGLTNIGDSIGIDSNGNLLIVDSYPTLTVSQVHNVLLGFDVASQLTDGEGNVAVGSSALASATLTSNNVAIGAAALSSVTGENGSAGMNTAVGVGASTSLTEGWINVSVGLNSMRDFENGSSNVAVGAGVMENSLGGDYNTAIGTRALQNMNPNGTVTLTVNDGGFQYPSGQGNTAVGNSAMQNATGGSYNTAVGEASLANNTTGFNNASFGSHSLSANETGNSNAAFGWGTLMNIENGHGNTAIGGHAGQFIGNGADYNTLIGFGATTAERWPNDNVSPTDIVNSAAIGAFATVTTSNTIQLGDLEIELVNTSGVVSASGFIGDGSGLTNIGTAGIDQNGNLMILDIEPTLTTSQTHNILLGAGVAPELTDGFNNIGIGGSALASATTTFDNVAIGPYTLSSVSSNSSGLNIAVGNSALKSMQSGWVNVAIGTTALKSANEGSNNVAIGAGAIEDATMTERNVAIGVDALHAGNKNWNSVAIGHNALLNVRSVIDEGDATLEEIVENSGNPSTTLDEMVYGFPGNVAIGTGAFASPQTSTATYTEFSMGNIAIGHMPMYNATKATNENIAIGTFSLAELEDGGGNISIGRESMSQLNVGSGNIAIGRNSMREGEDIRNSIAIGEYAMVSAEQSRQNTAVGAGSLRIIGSELTEDIGWTEDENGNDIWNPIATSNVAVGAYSMNNTKSGYQNVAVGRSSLLYNNEGFDNVAVGDRALRDNNASYNTGLGRHALQQNINGNYNTSVGYFSGGQLNTSGVSPTIGGNNNTFIGAFADTVSGVLIENSTAIGAGAIVTSSNTIQLGANNTALVNTSGIISATAFYGDGSGLTNVGLGGFDDGGNLKIVDGEITLTNSQTHNVLIGVGAAMSLTDGYENIVIGNSALASATTTFDNIAIGPNALRSVTYGNHGVSSNTSTSGLNIAIGESSLEDLQAGWVNLAIGTTSMENLLVGSLNVAMGAGALEDNAVGDRNVAIGVDALHQGGVNTNSIGIGNQALFNVSSNMIDPETGVYEIYSDNPSTTLDESIFGRPGNIAIGSGAYKSSSSTETISSANISIGHMAMFNATNDAFGNMAIGAFSLASTQENSSYNTAVGYGSQQSLYNGHSNVSLGLNSMKNIEKGWGNVALGHMSMRNTNNSTYNVAVGYQALRDLNTLTDNTENGTVTLTTIDGIEYQSGTRNVAVGAWAMRRATGGRQNTAVGDASLIQLENGIQNVAVGADALKWTKQTSYNVAVGVESMANLSGTVSYTDANNQVKFINSNGNTAIGTRAMQLTSYGSNNIAIGTEALLSKDNMNSVAVGNQALFNVTNIPDESNWGLNPEISNLEDYIENTDHPSTTLDESAYGLEGNIAIGAGAFASPQSTTSTITEFSMGNIAIGHMSMNNSTKSTGGNIAIGSQTLPVLEEGGGIVSIGSWAMNQFKDGYNIAAVGSGAGQNLVKGTYTTAIGNAAMRDAKYTFGNVAIGSFSLLKIGKDLDSYFDADNNRNDFDNNTSVGHASSHSLVEGSGNTVVGAYAMQSMSGGNTIDFGDWEYVSGKGNTAIGGSSMHAATGGSWNTALGHVTLAHNTTGFNNVALGVQALNENTEGGDNTSTGAYSLQRNTTGSSNTAIGSHSLDHNTEGSNNIGIGYAAMINHLVSNENIAIGNSAMSGLWDDNAELSLVLSGTYQMNNEYDNNFEFTHNTRNIAIGQNALRTNNGMWNVGVGEGALEMANLGAKNVGVGPFSLQMVGDNVGNSALGYFTLGSINFSGKNNIAMGIAAGSGLATGASMQIDNDHNSSDFNIFIGALSGSAGTPFYGGNNIFLGPNINAGKDFMYNTVAIGANIAPTDDNLMVFGNSSHNKWAFGLATTDSGKVIQVGNDTTNGNGAYLTAGGTWTNGSSILFKTNFIDLSSEWILDKISKLNIRKWDYKNTNETHIGPTSEEFINLFGVGIKNENSHISTIDVSGVALKGVQALIDENEIQKQQLKDQSDLINELYNRILALEKRVNE